VKAAGLDLLQLRHGITCAAEGLEKPCEKLYDRGMMPAPYASSIRKVPIACWGVPTVALSPYAANMIMDRHATTM
jgi:hypothetical protein